MGQTVVSDDGIFEWDNEKNWYKSSERAKHPHPKKLRVECSLDEDVIQWLKEETDEEEYPIYINSFLRKIMAGSREQ